MKIVEKIENGPVLICPDIHEDDRGYFYESFNEKEFKEKVIDTDFVQDNQSRSSYGVLRGMHFQTGEYVQAKLVRVVKGAVLDVVVDMRSSSPEKGKAYAYLLTEENHYQLFVPRGFAHGFLTLKDDTVFQYKCDNVYNKASEGSFNYNSFGFNWTKYVPAEKIIVSEKDSLAVDYNVCNGRKIVEIPKENIEAMVKKSIEDDMVVSLSALKKLDVGGAELKEEIYAELKDGNGGIVVAQLVGFTSVIYDPVSFSPIKKVICRIVDTNQERALSVHFDEVIRFYKYV